jgi:acyl carrier protein
MVEVNGGAAGSGDATERARALVAAAVERPVDAVPADGTVETVPGWDSLAHVRIITAVEDTLGRQLSSNQIAMIRGLPDIAALLTV